MEEDDILYQSIIADPEQVSPDVDVSGLRTQTETSPELLASVSEFPGLQFDPTQYSSYEDLYDLYSRGLPMVETGTAGDIAGETAIPTPVVETPVVETGVQDQVTGDLPTTNQLLEQGLTPTGVATITPNVFDPESEAAGIQPTGLDPNVFDYESEAADVQPTGISPNVFDYESEAAGIQPTGISPNVFDYEFEATTPEQRAEALTQEQIEDTGIVDKAINALGNVTRDQVIKAAQVGRIGLAALSGGTSEVINTIGRIIGGAVITDAAADVAADKLLQATGAITPTSTAEDIALNLQQEQASLDPNQNIIDEVALTTGQTPAEQIIDQGETTSDAGFADAVNQADVEAGLATESIEDFSPVQTFSDSGGDDTSSSPSPSPSSSFDYESEAYGTDSGGSSGGGGGKIVCTMMNETYGFGSFRNKIWQKYAKDNLTKEHEKGYHKIFLPLVRLSKTNIIVRKILEHIAVHRTIDIRQEARGKTHILGRVYRKVLEPICYLVGKYGKR